MTRACAIALAILFCISSYAHAQQKRIATYDFWETFASDNRNECSARAVPDIASPLSGGLVLSVIPTRTLIIIRVKTRDFNFHPTLKTVFAFEDKIFNLHTINRSGFINYGSPENELLNRFRTRSEVTLWSMTANEVQLKDTFSLKGFSQALDRALQECRRVPTPTTVQLPASSIPSAAQSSATATIQRHDITIFTNPTNILYAVGFILLLGGGLLALAPRNTTSSAQSLSPSSVDTALRTSDQQVTPQPFSNSGPVKGMALKRKRHQRKGSFGTTIFTLDARMEVSAENRALIATYKLGDHVIYESANREKYAARARQHAENTRDQPGLLASPGAQAWGFAKTLGRIGASVFNATASALSLRITVNSLIEGVHVESKSMEEILEAEESIKDAAANLKAYLETSTTFSGQEEIIDL